MVDRFCFVCIRRLFLCAENIFFSLGLTGHLYQVSFFIGRFMMKGLTNALASSGSGGDLVYAVNNTGADVVAGQKVWLNKHNNTDNDSVWVSGGYSSYIKGRFFFFDGNNNFIAYNAADDFQKGIYDTLNKQWTITRQELTNQGVYPISMNYNALEGKYYGAYICMDGLYGSYKPCSVIYDNNGEFQFFADEIVLCEQFSLKFNEAGSSSFKYDIIDRSDGSLVYILDFSERQEVLKTIYCVKNDHIYDFFVISQERNSPKNVYSYTFQLVKSGMSWLYGGTLGGDDVLNLEILQPTMRYFTGLNDGDYFITTETIAAKDTFRPYPVQFYKKSGRKLVVADDLPDDLQMLLYQNCNVHYDGRLKRLYISTASGFYLYILDNGKFVNANLTLDDADLIVPYERAYSFGVSDDMTTVAIHAQTSASSGKFQVLKLSRPHDLEWYAENYPQFNSYSLTGFATGKTDGLGRVQISTVLPETVDYTISFSSDVDTFEFMGEAE